MSELTLNLQKEDKIKNYELLYHRESLDSNNDKVKILIDI